MYIWRERLSSPWSIRLNTPRGSWSTPVEACNIWTAMGTVSSRRGTIGYLLSTWLLRMAACTRCAYCTAPLFRWKRFSSTVLTDLLCRHSTSSNWHFHLSLNWYPVRVMGVSPDGQYFAELQHLCACQYQPINLYMFLVILQNLPLGDPRVPVINRSCIWTFAWTSLLRSLKSRFHVVVPYITKRAEPLSVSLLRFGNYIL